MRGAIQRWTAPIFARLPDLSGVPQRRQIRGAIIVSALLHLLIFTVAIVLSWLFPEPPEEPERPPELADLTVELVPPPPPPAAIPPSLMAASEPPVIDANGLEKSDVAPTEKVFQSSQDMIAGSEREGKGSEPLPTQDGLDLPGAEFKTQAAKLGKSAEPAEEAPPDSGPPLPPMYKPKPLSKQYLEALAKIQADDSPPPPPSPADTVPQPVEPVPPPDEKKMAATREDEIPIFQKPAEPPAVTTKVTPLDPPKPIPNRPKPPAATPARELAMLTPPTRPQPVRDPGYQPEMHQTRIEGSISNRGKPGVNAEKTTLGVYRAAVSAQIHSRWQYYTKQRMGLLDFGTVTVRFFISQKGRVEDVRVLQNNSNATFASVCEQSIRDAEIAPPPDDLEMMNDGRLELVFTFTLF